MDKKRPPLQLAWYQSRVIMRAIVGLALLLLDKFNVSHGIVAADVAEIVDLILTITGSGAIISAGYARVTQEYAPPIAGSTIKRVAVWPLLILLLLAACTRPERERIALAVVEGVALTRELCVKFLGIWPNGQTGFHVACALLVMPAVPPGFSPAEDGADRSNDDAKLSVRWNE